MKRIKIIIELLVRFWSGIYSYRMNIWIKYYHNVLYTMWIRQFLGEVGNCVMISRPLILQGGGQKRIKIGSHTNIGHHTVLGCWVCNSHNKETIHNAPEIVIGPHCNIGEYCHITSIRRITIGEGLLTGRFVYIGDNSHGGLSWDEAEISPIKRELKSKGEIVIGRNVWIGDKATILGGVTIGNNVIIGANTVVTHDIPSNTVVVGGALREIKRLKESL